MNAQTKTVVLAALCAAALPARERTAEFELGTTPLQELRGWGMTPCALDWDGRMTLHAEATKQIRDVYRECHASVIRLLVGGTNVYNNENLQARPVAAMLEDHIKLARDAGIQAYVITLLSAPPFLKMYYTSSGRVYMNPNQLRVECEELFSGYVVDILEQLKQRHLTLPEAISLQMQPEDPQYDWGIPVTAAHGTYYSAEQWSRVLRKTRLEMNKHGLREVGLIGPETFGPLGWEDPDPAKDGNENDASILSGWAYDSAGVRELESQNHRARSVIETIQGMRAHNAIWMLSSNCNNAENDGDVIVQTFQLLRHDLVEVGASYWLWRYAFSWTPSSECLGFGRAGQRAPICDALAKLWGAAPPGAKVYPLLRQKDKDVASELEGFALVLSKRRVFVLINGAHHEATVALRNLSGTVNADYWGGATHRHQAIANEADLHFVNIPPRTIAIVVNETP